MNKMHSLIVLMILTASIPMCSWAAHPCKEIALACMQQGYYKGGQEVGRGLVENCIMPVVENRKSLPTGTFSNETLQHCKADIIEKMKSSQENQQLT